MKLKYWTGFSKRKNSTKVPSGIGTEIDIVLKEDTPIDNPSIVLTGTGINLDYCYINDFGKYYFVGEPIILTNGLLQYDLQEDVLATHKTEIGNTIAYIAYSSSGYDVYLPDPRLPVKAMTSTNQDAAASGLSSEGCFVVSLITDKANGVSGSIGHFVINAQNLQNLVANLYDVSVQSVISEIFYSPMDMIANCIWIPVSYADATANCSAAENICLNQSPISTASRPVYGSQITTPLKQFTGVGITIFDRNGDFRDCQPYTTASLYLPGVGLTDININDFAGSAKVNILPRVDLTNGDIIYIIYTDHGDIVQTVSFNGAAQIPIGHVAADSKGALAGIGGVAGVAANFLAGNPLSPTIAAMSLLTAANGVVSANQRAVSLKGGYSGRSSFASAAFSLTIVKQQTADPTNANYIAKWGRPVGKTQAISNHSGFVQCIDASVDIAGDNAEREAINSFLNSGFFYE